MAARAPWVVLSAMFVAIACGPPPVVSDGGPPGDGRPGATSARVVVPSEAIEAGDVTFTSFRLAVASVRLISDRGAAFDPVSTTVGVIDLARENVIVLDEIPPASYSEALLTLDGAATTLEIEATDAVVGPVHVRYASRLEWMARCGSGIAIDVGDTLEVRVDLELGDAWEALRAAPDLPAPTAGVIEVDETSAPGALGSFLDMLEARLSADCDHDAS